MTDSESSLPPRQQLTEKFPVVGERQADRLLTQDDWQLTLFDRGQNVLQLNFDQLLALPQTVQRWDIHCVTRWSRRGDEFTGVLFGDLLTAAGVSAPTEFVRFVAYSQRNHDTSLPLAACLDEPVLLVHKINGQPLAPEHGFPVRTIAPGRYFYKSLKWLKEIHLVEQDQLGFWERGGYHNDADYKRELRYTSGNLTPRALEQLRKNLNFDKYRGQVLLSLDLRGLDLTGADLSGVQLKNCQLDDCQLAGANLRGANFSNSTLLNTNLRNADLTGADLDGVLLMGSDLTGANLSATFLNATEFTRPGYDPATVTNAVFSGAQISGLVEAQVQFLTAQGILINPE